MIDFSRGQAAAIRDWGTRRWLLAAVAPIAMVALILGADFLEGPKTSFVGMLTVVPMFSAVFCSPRVTGIVGAFTVVAAGLFGVIASDGNTPAQFARLVMLAVVTVLAVLAARLRRRMEHQLSDALVAADRASRRAELAEQDWLTGLANRRGVMTAVAKRPRGPRDRSWLALIDIDGLKQVNDSLGHKAGDELIKAVGGRLASHVASRDLVGRWGGDEFVILLDLPDGRAERVLQRVTADVCAQPVATTFGEIPVSISWGVAHFAPEDTFDDALVAADRRMYAAKRCLDPS